MPAIVPVSLGTSTQFTCAITIEDHTGDTVSVKYQGLPGNQPKDSNNFVAIWEASTIPWTAKPLKQVPIEVNHELGSLVIDGLTITKASYTVGYSVGAAITDISCCAVLGVGGLTAPPSAISLVIDKIYTDSIVVGYRTLNGYLPQKYGNWIGLWQGFASPYNPFDPMATTAITSNASEGIVGINNVTFGLNTNYTLIYFTGKPYTTAAAIINFNTGDLDD
ncbi:hypothetical protein HB364_18080 [Pseudoflavitalea sp. X16]|uniref:hypothetical protein n=1 Tax=Paraflavitalea devenefica TaxID=2716334 RepID=UPI001420A951|nr:hypothetical protein [Paraflavitalea devenefica]NII27005.1 hypothetical protein [Paraflavitalea devenefica]